MSTFDGLSVALSGLYAQRRGLDVTGQNIANANTDGYTRQRVTLESVGAPAVPAMWSTWTGAGGGVQVSGIDRLSDAFLETRVRDGHATLKDLTAGRDVLAQIEQLFPEPGTQGLQAHLSDLWAAFGDVANQPADLSARSQLLQRASIVTDWLNQTSAQLVTQGQSATTDLGVMTQEVNTTAAQIADLNGAIAQGSAAGASVNELADKRDQLSLKLAELVGATSRTDDQGQVTVSVSGSPIVSGTHAEAVQLAVSAGTVTLQWARDGSTVALSSGQMHGLVDAVNTTIPAWSARLDAFAADLANQVNTVHQAGYDLNGNAGGAIFSGTTAASIHVAITDPALVAASSVPPSGGVVSLDSGNADALAAVGARTTSPDATYRQLVSDLGIASQTASQRTDTQTAITTNLDSAHESQSGVSIDEEMTNLLSYQRAYEAASRVITAVDSTLDTLVNRTGLVGR